MIQNEDEAAKMLDEAHTPLPSTGLVFAMSPRTGPLFTEQLFVSILYANIFPWSTVPQTKENDFCSQGGAQ